MKRNLNDNKGVVTIEVAIIMAVLVLPIAIAVAKFKDPIINWVVTTSQNLEKNNELQQENNNLLHQLLDQQNGQTGDSSPETNSNSS